jgi:nucleotide-binding universal stress UspA family protein
MNILVAYDGTKEAKEAARLACKHAKAFNGRIILAYSMVGGPEIPRKEFEHAEKELQSQVRGLETGEDIIKIAEEKKAEEIIIGIQRRSKVGKLLFGSTAQYIILNAPCPVVTVR